MDGVVLAAGEGTRMRPLTADRPKALVEVAGQPLLSYALDALLSVGVDRMVVVIGYRGEAISDRYGDSYRETPLAYVEQHEQLGTAHALQRALPKVPAPLVVMNGDNVCRANLGEVVERHHRSDAAGRAGFARTGAENGRSRNRRRRPGHRTRRETRESTVNARESGVLRVRVGDRTRN